jgi:diadenosine tetraphosphate (Ap4A) HIT family hydrolase
MPNQPQLIRPDIAAELASGCMPEHFQTCLGRSSRILAETQTLTLLPTVSPLVLGHVLIFTKQDATSFADLVDRNCNLRVEFSCLVREYERRFGTAIMFEHGSSGKQLTACGVSRGHVHLVPSCSINADQLSGAIKRELGSPSRVTDWLPEKDLQGREYLSFGPIDGRVETWVSNEISSQLVRRLISKQIGLSQWDWNALFGWDVLERTLTDWERRPYAHGAQYQHTLLHA